MQPVEPIFTVELFPELSSQLIHLLEALRVEAWQKPTICSPWTVKDLAAHLLDGDLRRLSFHRDKLPRLQPETAIANYSDLVDFLNQLNHTWVKAAQRISPQLLIELLKLSGQQVYEFFKTLDPFQPALFSVAWAGEEISPNWFDVAREYTERWLHQQQIRDAVNRPGLTERHLFYPVLDTFLRALPFTYRGVEAADGTTLSVFIRGEAGGEWSLVREKGTWQLFHGYQANAAALISLDQDTAWRLFSKGLSPLEARKRVQVEGEEKLGLGILGMVSIMA
jgi:uncharacterized protein (TIGR03083 family)